MISIEMKEDGVTRNAVIGKLYRMGLRRGEEGTTRAKKPEQKPRKSSGRRVPFNTIVHGNGRQAQQVTCEVDGVEPLHIGLMELERHHCRFPYGQGDAYTFCGQDNVEGSSYCEEHRRITRSEEAAKRNGADRRVDATKAGAARRRDALAMG